MTKLKRLTLQLQPETIIKAKKLALDKGCSVSDLFRGLLDETTSKTTVS
jgi:hypothetical protein